MVKFRKGHEKLSRQQAPRDEVREPQPLHEHTHPQCHIIFMELFQYNLPEPPTSDRQGYQIHDQHRHAEDPPVRYILYYDSIQDEAYHRYRA